MKSFRKELWFEIPSRRGFVNITPQVQECLRASGIAVCEETARPGSDGIFVRHNRNLVDAHIIYLEKERRDLTAAVKFYCGGDLTDAHSAIADVRAPRRVVEAQIRRYSDLPNS